MASFGALQEADLVLGGDEGKECTYKKGYMKRQAVFSCLTCTPNGDAGFCTACSLSCHDGHDVRSSHTTFREIG
jgi:E3 ubiquitin-protein ligase UBR7